MVQEGQSIIHKWSVENVLFVTKRVVHLGHNASHEAMFEVYGMSAVYVCYLSPQNIANDFQPQDIREKTKPQKSTDF